MKNAVQIDLKSFDLPDPNVAFAMANYFGVWDRMNRKPEKQ